MKKFLLVMCFFGAANLFAGTCNGFCKSVVFQNDSAYIKTDVVPVLQDMCDRYGLLEVVCDAVDFRADGSAWIVDSELENIKEYCTTACSVKETEKSFFENLATVNWRR